jgi:phospholipid:diacylglycerol acyltransferase
LIQKIGYPTNFDTGSSLFPYFLKWVESPLGGNGGPHWTNNHIESFVNIAGSLLGVPKAISTLLSGKLYTTFTLSIHATKCILYR